MYAIEKLGVAQVRGGLSGGQHRGGWHEQASRDVADEPGWRIAGRIDLGPLSVFEATYMGLADFNYRENVNSLDVDPNDYQLESVFSTYGQNVAIFPILGIDDGRSHRLSYHSELHLNFSRLSVEELRTRDHATPTGC